MMTYERNAVVFRGGAVEVTTVYVTYPYGAAQYYAYWRGFAGRATRTDPDGIRRAQLPKAYPQYQVRPPRTQPLVSGLPVPDLRGAGRPQAATDHLQGGIVETKLSQLRAMWAAGDRAGALKMAAKWPRLGDKADVIRKGHSAATRPEFYRELGVDVDAAVEAAYAALAERYELKGG